MREVLEPLARVPGVCYAVMVSADGVPIAVQGRASKRTAEPDPLRFSGSPEDLTAFAGLAAGWLNEIRRAVDPLTWDPPQRVVLRAQRGTLILLTTRGAILAVVLDRGMAPEELRLPMEAASARLQRLLRRTGAPERQPAEQAQQAQQAQTERRQPPADRPQASSERAPASPERRSPRTNSHASLPPAALPAHERRDRNGNVVPEATRER